MNANPMSFGAFLTKGCLTAALLLGVLIAGQVSAQAQEHTGGLTTHVLDTANGKPAAGMRIDFYVQEGDEYRLVKTVQTNKDGRTDEPLLTGESMATGRYQLVFHVAAYFAERGVSLPEPPFLDQVPLQFAIFDATQHYHVPLLVSAWSYSTYRGS